MARAKVSDGKSVKVIASKALNDGQFALESGFHGFVVGNVEAGSRVVLNIEQAEYEFTLANCNAGEIVYSTPAGALTKTATANRPVLRVTVGTDAQGTVWGILLPQQVN